MPRPHSLAWLTAAAQLSVLTSLAAQSPFPAAARKAGVEFRPPVQVMADGKAIEVEEPGYAAPCLYDVDGDGKKDLVVGQFNGGKLKIYRNLRDGKFAAGEWLVADGDVAEVPGVW